MWYMYFKNMIKNGNMLLNDIYEEHQPAVLMNVQGNRIKFQFPESVHSYFQKH